MIKHKTLLCALALATMALRCGPDKDPVTSDPVVRIPISFMVGNQRLVPGRKYAAVASDSFQVQHMALYISNVKLVDRYSGWFWAQPDSYHYLNPMQGDTVITLNNPPTQSFGFLEFSIGVDSVANSRIDYVGKGELSLNQGMAWDWNTGYKFILMEGGRKPADSTRFTAMAIHMGGNTTYRTVRLPLTNLTTTRGRTHTISLNADLRKLFDGPRTIRMSQVNAILHGGENFADNAASIFTVVQ